MIFMRDRRAEQRHHPVAGELIYRAFEAVHGGGRDLEKILDETEPLFGIEPFGEVHRALYIGEQDRDALAFHLPAPDGPDESCRRDARVAAACADPG